MATPEINFEHCKFIAYVDWAWLICDFQFSLLTV